jgi:hypothetical protein
MTVLELCSLVKYPERQDVIIYDEMSADGEIIFKDSVYNAILSQFSDWEVHDFGTLSYNYGPVLFVHAIERRPGK